MHPGKKCYFSDGVSGLITAGPRRRRCTAPAQATLGYWHSLYSTTSHSAFPKNIFLYIQCGCHVSCQQSCQYETIVRRGAAPAPPAASRRRLQLKNYIISALYNNKYFSMASKSLETIRNRFRLMFATFLICNMLYSCRALRCTSRRTTWGSSTGAGRR